MNLQLQELADEVIHMLESWSKAYPTSMFPDPTQEDIDYINAENKNLSARFFAHIGRHFINKGFTPAINMLRQQADRIAELEKEKDRLEKLVHQRFDDGKRLGIIETEDRLLKQSEPVAWFDGEHYVCPEIGYEYTITTEHPKALGWKPLYTTPQTKRLSDEEIIKIFNQIWVAGGNTNGVMHRFAKAIEERHGIK